MDFSTDDFMVDDYMNAPQGHISVLGETFQEPTPTSVEEDVIFNPKREPMWFSAGDIYNAYIN